MEMCKSFRLVDLRLGFTFSRIRSSSECRLLRGQHGSAFSPLPALCFSAEMFVNLNPPFTYIWTHLELEGHVLIKRGKLGLKFPAADPLAIQSLPHRLQL